MRSLIYHMTNNLSVAKCDAIIHFIPMLTESVIQMKYEDLCNRIPWAAFEASFISALPVPFLDILLNVFVMKRELQCFIEAFYLNSTEANEVPEVHSRWAISYFEQFILTGIKAIINSGTVVAAITTAALSQIPCTCFRLCYRSWNNLQIRKVFFTEKLERNEKDAEIVFKNTLQKYLPRGNV
ncbi:unnamed protein product [Mytilus edulis]|uniref:Uncharacterized protein n=1 Tax=Mytilus edulis TaxID=6550 RepID=A0A8S3R7L2_MYTED|nr:unnamed protein product [Mytilus edulis]